VTSIATAARRHALSRPVVREAFTELVATAFLLIAVVGSGIMAEKLCGGNVGLALLANAIATGGALVALILAFGPQSGAHMNPLSRSPPRRRRAYDGTRCRPTSPLSSPAPSSACGWHISCSICRSGSYRSTYGQECRNGSPR
jgi:hypothetical protein